MAKRNVAYIKPDEPAFLKRIKQQIGYQEHEDHIEMKKGPIENLSDEDDDEREERDDEKPQVVQLREGDLTEEEAKRIEKEEAEKPADLDQRIIFKVKKKKDIDEKDAEKSRSNEPSSRGKSDKKSKKEKPTKNLLSFEEEDE